MDFMNSGHRGAMGLAPENTMTSFRLAVEHGANEIELDLRLSKDGVLVIMHDATVDRTTNGSGAVADLSYEHLRELDAGDGQGVPTLDEVLMGTDVPLQVEIKSPDSVDPFLDLLDERPDLLPRMSPSSFDEKIAATVATRLPTTAVGLIAKEASVEALRRAEGVGARRVLLGWSGTDPGLIADARKRGLHFGLWPVNTPGQFLDAVELGVDGLTTDFPKIMWDSGYELQDGALTRQAVTGTRQHE